MAYRIPRKKFDPNAVSLFERRSTETPQPVKEPSTPAIVVPTGPRNSQPQRNSKYITSRAPPRRNFHSLPTGWFMATDNAGNPYYYSKSGHTTWQRPYQPAPEPPPPPKVPPKSVQSAKALQDIIDSITKSDPSRTPIRSEQQAATSTPPKEKKKPSDKWRALSIEKQMKLYENTLFPHIKHVMKKYAQQLPKDDLKKFAKEVGKKLVASDFKNKRVEDPTKISEKQEKKVKSYVREYFEKAVEKKKAIDKRKREKKALAKPSTPETPMPNGQTDKEITENGEAMEEDADVDLSNDLEKQESDDDDDIVSDDDDKYPDAEMETPSFDNSDLKRKRGNSDSGTPYEDTDLNKRLREDEPSTVDVSPPPPPPPPPADGMPLDFSFNGGAGPDHEPNHHEGDVDDTMTVVKEETEEERELRKQEEELMRENEEAILMDMDGTLKAEEKLHSRVSGVEGGHLKGLLEPKPEGVLSH